MCQWRTSAIGPASTPAYRAGFANPTLYAIAKGSNYNQDFHDITSGGNGIYSAGVGYDNVTGWGSYNGGNLYSDVIRYVTKGAGVIPAVNFLLRGDQ
jgi:hypothetical protein